MIQNFEVKWLYNYDYSKILSDMVYSYENRNYNQP